MAAEFALVRRARPDLQTDANAGKKGETRYGRHHLRPVGVTWSAAQVGITLTSLGLGFLGEPAIGSLIESAIGEQGPRTGSRPSSRSGSRPITTSIHIHPPGQGRRSTRSRRLYWPLCVCARPLLIFTKIFSPFIGALNGASNAILRVLGVRTMGQLDEGENAQELRVR